MDFEQDYIMRLIKDMVSFLMYGVTGLETFCEQCDFL